MKTFRLLAPLAALSLVTPAFAAFNMDYVTIGNAGNAADTADGDVFTEGIQRFGSVGYVYQIGKYEVTNAQYAEFLNAADPGGVNANGIYNASMGSNIRGGITYTSGSASGSKYTTRTNMGNKPVNYVSWFDAVRFTNWMATGNTETGSYTLNGATSGIVTKNVGATVYIPSEDEWYKAAYSNPADSSYSIYPTQSNTAPTIAAADASGNISNPGANVANYNYGADWNGQDGNMTTVGSAGAASASFYGTFDQGGNAYEWNDAVISTTARGLRAGSWNSDENLISSYLMSANAVLENQYNGFRVASVSIPEPSVWVLTILASGMIMTRRKRSHAPC
jgi:formylglycine-generating enzyme required for sulfatase activity